MLSSLERTDALLFAGPTMNTIPLTSIVIPEDRQRKQKSPAIPDIAASILADGMFHALVLRPDNRTLIAGETRYNALCTLPPDFQIRYDGQLLPPGHVPYTVSSSDDELSLFEIELHENICRAELHWSDKAIAIERLDELRRKQHGSYDPKTNPTGWSAAKTAGEINKDTPSGSKGGFVTKVKEDLALADALRTNPDLAKIKDRGKALKELRQLARRTERAIADLTPPSESHNVTYSIQDALAFIASLPDSSIDIVLSDPPYGRNLHNDALWSGDVRDFDDSPEAYTALMTELIPLLETKMAKRSHLYFFCDLYHFEFLSGLLELSGIIPWRHPIIWDKNHMGSFANIDYGPRHTYDTIIYANKGNREVIDHAHDVIRGIVPLDSKLHPDEKPAALLDNLLARSARPNDAVLDPFCGSGSIIPVAYNRNCRLFLSESDAQWEPTIQSRIASLGANSWEPPF
jgi:site-specific DNA-methyltransferase (adenine-specific)